MILRIRDVDTTRNKTYSYDALDRLTGALGPWGTLSYTYDGVGNRQTETTGTGVTNYAYNANKLTGSIGGKAFTFAYDNNGNTVAESRELTADRLYIYNQNQRLIKVTEGGVTKGEYVYNGNGQRVKKTTSSGTTVFHYDLDGHILAESTPTGATTAEYGLLNGSPFSKMERNNVYYYHSDHLDVPMRMTNSSGVIVWDGEFLPFGEPLSITGAITNNLRFPGQYYDEETGLHYNYFRDYQPMTGRYVETDPVGIEKRGNHLYVYVGNNPVNEKDPLGLQNEPPKPPPPPPPGRPGQPVPGRPPMKPPPPPGMGCGAMFRLCMAYCTGPCPPGPFLIVKGVCIVGCVLTWIACIAAGN